MSAPLQTFEDTAEAVLAAALADPAEPCALVILTASEGGGVRSPGALMAVPVRSAAAGYVSGGCVDADLIGQARQALGDGQIRRLRYGRGSPFGDIRLPCGGAIGLTILPQPERALLARWHATLQARRTVWLGLAPDGALCLHDAPPVQPARLPGHLFRYTPALRLRLAGRGADVQALARLASASGIACEAWLTQPADIAALERLPCLSARRLTSPAALPDAHDDAFTAFVLLFHEPDWELPLLRQALAGPAFFVGAVGSQRAQSRRLDALRADGLPESMLARLHGPVGLLPAMRSASTLAVSALAAIVQAFDALTRSPFEGTALLLLAAGQSSRFEAGDKLIAMLDGRPVLAHAASLLAGAPFTARLAVTAPGQNARAAILSGHGWSCVENPQPSRGLAASLATGMAALAGDPRIRRVVILLADMPHVSDGHVAGLLEAMTPGVQAVMSETGGVLGPPAVFVRDAFPALQSLQGDRGARAVFDTLAHTCTLALGAGAAIDIDCLADLARAGGAIPA